MMSTLGKPQKATKATNGKGTLENACQVIHYAG